MSFPETCHSLNSIFCQVAMEKLENENKLLQTKVQSLLATNSNEAEGNDGTNSVVSDCKEAAFQVAKEQFLAGMAYEPSSGLYYDYKVNLLKLCQAF